MTLDAQTVLAIAACVRSIEELEVLLRLAGNAGRYCSAAMIAAETGLPVAAAAAALETLASRNLLAVRTAAAVLYKLDPASADVRACLERTLAVARRSRGDIIRAVAVQASTAQPVADASEKDRRE